MRTLLTLSVIAVLAGTMSAYAIDQQRSDEAPGYVLSHRVGPAAPAFAPGARAQAPSVTAPGFAAPLFKAPVDVQDPNLSR